MDGIDPDIVAKFQKDGLTYGEISVILEEEYGQQRGLSERSVRRYCKKHGIEKRDDEEIDEVVEEAVQESFTKLYYACMLNGTWPQIRQMIPSKKILRYRGLSTTSCDITQLVGETYGRKMMKGYLASKGICINEKKVADSLCRVAPQSYETRRHSIINTINPVPYHASRFGHKLHLDQNEKLVMFSVTHVLGVDGYSGHNSVSFHHAS
uniref:Uncharacterized protein n=1 Tax=Amphimedon queenslandica TaxID=400682 RepID=A0A1X7UV32_AMPQE